MGFDDKIWLLLLGLFGHFLLRLGLLELDTLQSCDPECEQLVIIVIGLSCVGGLALCRCVIVIAKIN